jgi:large subunit ribosomal protein L1
MPKRSKRYKSMVETLDKEKSYTVEEAVEILKSNKFHAKFDETVEVAITLGVDTKQAEQQVRGTFSLPHGTGKTVKVIAFAEGPEAEAARNAGAVEVGGEELAKKIEGGWTDFDVAIAHPSTMRYVGKLGKILGPQGKMPSPKSGTITADVAKAVAEFKGGKIEFRTNTQGNIHVPVGKMSFEKKALVDNITSFIEHVKGLRPSSVKGIYFRKACVSSTMGPGLKLVNN